MTKKFDNFEAIFNINFLEEEIVKLFCNNFDEIRGFIVKLFCNSTVGQWDALPQQAVPGAVPEWKRMYCRL